MTYTLPPSLRDREFNKFLSDTGSHSAMAVAITSGTIPVTISGATFTTGSESWIKNFDDLGSTVIIDDPVTIGSYTTQTIVGSVAITNAISVTTGSESWIKNTVEVSGIVTTHRAYTFNPKIHKQVIRHAAGSTDVWQAGAGSKIVITDMFCSIGSPTNEITVSAGGSILTHAYLAENGGFVTNLQTPFESQTNGSIYFQTSSIGSANLSLTGYEVV